MYTLIIILVVILLLVISFIIGAVLLDVIERKTAGKSAYADYFPLEDASLNDVGDMLLLAFVSTFFWPIIALCVGVVYMLKNIQEKNYFNIKKDEEND